MGTTNFDKVEANKVKVSNATKVSVANATATASTVTVDPTEFAGVVALANDLKAKFNALVSGT